MISYPLRVAIRALSFATRESRAIIIFINKPFMSLTNSNYVALCSCFHKKL